MLNGPPKPAVPLPPLLLLPLLLLLLVLVPDGAVVCMTRKVCPPASTTDVLPDPLVLSAPTTWLL
jgi:hypothetical protein